MDPASQVDRTPWVRTLATIAVVVFIATIVFTVVNYVSTDDWTDRGTRGDFLGGHVAAGMTFVANLLLLVALLMQRQELKYQREELRATRDEMRQSREVSERQETHLRKQVQISEKTAIITRIVEFSQLRDQLRVARIQAVPKTYAGSPERTAEIGKQIQETDGWWRERVEGVDLLLKSLLEQDCLGDTERSAIHDAVGLREPPAHGITVPDK